MLTKFCTDAATERVFCSVDTTSVIRTFEEAVDVFAPDGSLGGLDGTVSSIKLSGLPITSFALCKISSHVYACIIKNVFLFLLFLL